MTSIYIAGSSSLQGPLREAATILEIAGHKITSRWLDSPVGVGTVPELDDDAVTFLAVRDLADIQLADVFMMFVPWEDGAHYHTGGRHVETGYALALDKTVIVVGEPENIFQRGACIVVPDLTAALDVLT